MLFRSASEAGQPIEYALEGSVFVGGAIIKWLRDGMKLIHEARDSEYFAQKVADTEGVYLVPAFSGLGAPFWDMHARGTIVGLTAGAGKNHIIRAALESIAFQTNDVISAMRSDMNSDLSCLRVDGGASANGLLMQMQSDISGIRVIRSENAEATAAGAAFLAGLAVGFFESRQDIKILLSEKDSFSPAIDESTRKAKFKGWQRAVRACRCFAESEE